MFKILACRPNDVQVGCLAQLSQLLKGVLRGPVVIVVTDADKKCTLARGASGVRGLFADGLPPIWAVLILRDAVA